MNLADVPAGQVVEVLKVFAFAIGILSGLISVGDW